MSIFKDTNLNISSLRDCQSEACEAAQSHYAKKGAERHTLLQLPTGTGKSALIAALPFFIPCERVLVLVPNLGLVTQMKEDLDIVDHPKINAYKKFKLLNEQQIDDANLFVMPLDAKVNRTDIQDHQIIIANYHKFQQIEKWFGKNSDLIDMIIIDEAHHQAAGTYQEIIKFFDKAKVVGLTATPFRSDGKPVDGKNIYTYHFRSAIEKGYIRNIKVSNVTPQTVQLEFTEEGTTETYTLQQIMDSMKEQAWFNKGIALSQDCCDSIADRAVEKLKDLRQNFPQTDHQIIASGMTIRHAREHIKPAFERHNLKVGIVSSHEEDRSKNEETIKKLRQNKLDVIINVGMLGEGFNQPTLGVAAIFRPYKSLNPYIQFIGRVIRSNPPAKYCYVVSHLGLNQIKRFEEFKLFDGEDTEFLKELFDGQGSTNEDIAFVEEEAADKEGEGDQVSSNDDFVVHQSSEGLMDVGDMFVNEKKLEQTVEQYNQLSETERIAFLKRLGIKDGTVKKIRPEKIKPIQKRLAKKNALNEVAKSVTTDTLKELGVKHYGRDFNKMWNNFAWVSRKINKLINASLNIDQKQRNTLTVDQLETFEKSDRIKEIRTEAIAYFRDKIQAK